MEHVVLHQLNLGLLGFTDIDEIFAVSMQFPVSMFNCMLQLLPSTCHLNFHAQQRWKVQGVQLPAQHRCTDSATEMAHRPSNARGLLEVQSIYLLHQPSNDEGSCTYQAEAAVADFLSDAPNPNVWGCLW